MSSSSHGSSCRGVSQSHFAHRFGLLVQRAHEAQAWVSAGTHQITKSLIRCRCRHRVRSVPRVNRLRSIHCHSIRGSAVIPHPPAKVSPDAVVHERQPAPRRDAPVILHSARFSREQALRSVDSLQAKQEALHLLEKDTVARSSVGQRDSLLRSWVSFHDAWFATAQSHSQTVEVFPITVLKIYAVGALLKSGGHRSPANYFTKAKEEHIKLGFQWSDALQLAVRKATTSVTRGIGPARQSAPRSRDGVAGRVPVGVSRMRLTPWR